MSVNVRLRRVRLVPLALALVAAGCSRARDGDDAAAARPDESEGSDRERENTQPPDETMDPGGPEVVAPGGLGGSSSMTPDPPRERPDASEGDASPAPRDCSEQAITFDELYDLIQADLAPHSAAEQVSFRYVTLSDRFNAGICAGQLDADRSALAKALNLLSTSTELHPPVAVDADRILYRLDLRDYEWDRAIPVRGVDFADAWEALIANDPYATPLVGAVADDVAADTGTDVPVVFANALLDATLNGALYYALIDVNAAQSLDVFIRDELEIDVVTNMALGDVARAGTSRSLVARGDRLVERHAIENRPGVFWQTFDFDAASSDTFFEDPFGVAADGRLAIFTLRNGLFGFIGADAQGQIVEATSGLVSVDASGAALRAASSCLGCHAAGLLSVVDEVRLIVLSDPLITPEEAAELREIYPSAAEFESIVAGDNAPQLGALQALGVSPAEPEPISTVLGQFNQSLNIGRAAAELGVLPAELRAALPRLSPSLSVLTEDGRVERDDWEQLYRSTLCAVSADARNRPSPDVCGGP